MDLSDLQDDWVALVDRSYQVGYDVLSPDERTWLNAQSLLQALENGGLISFFYNSGADHLEDTKKALERLGLVEMQQLLDGVCDLFPDGVPGDIDARNDVISSWPDDGSVDEVLTALDDRALAQSDAFADRIVTFVGDSGLARQRASR
ncbi:MAG: DUF4375 domain-containing protein [Acidobacteria bacterium]|nr:MAG: DUF4375 domain-containing protein [Acidobacteriota bacterium]REK08791.1 MAG: DUF4375 domain-containing protein [Acidobacteriota bacterium]